MNNLTTRKIVLGMLMALVLAFSVQGTADALTFKESRTGDVVTLSPNKKEFTIRFSVNLTSSKDIYDTTETPKRQEDEVGVDIDSSGYKVRGIEVDGKTKYFRISDSVLVDTSGYVIVETRKDDPRYPDNPDTDADETRYLDPGDRDRDSDGDQIKAKPDDPLSDSLQHHYNDEAIGIYVITTAGGSLNSLKKGDANILLSGNAAPGRPSAFSNVDLTTVSLIEKTKNRDLDSDLTLTSSVTLKGEVAGPGVYTIKIVDMTHAGDFLVAPVDPADRAFLTFTIYSVPGSDRDTPLTLRGAGIDGYEFADDFDDPRIDGLFGDDDSAFGDAENIPLIYEVEGSGRVYVREDSGNNTNYGDGSPKSQGSATKTLSTSSQAPVYLDMGGGSSTVTVSIRGQNPTVTAESITFIYDYAELSIINGYDANGVAKGAGGGRLEEHIGIRVTDAKRRAVPGAAVKFSSDQDDGRFIPYPGDKIYIESTGAAFDGTNPAVTPAATSYPTNEGLSTILDPLTPTTYPLVLFVQTDSRGEAKVYYQLGDVDEDDPPEVNVVKIETVGLEDPKFRATAVDDKRQASLEIVSGDGQRAPKGRELADPLVIIARSISGYRIPNVIIEFEALTGIFTPTADTQQPSEGPGPGQLPANVKVVPSGDELFVITDSDGMAAVNYNVGQLEIGQTVSAEVFDELGTTEYDFVIDRVLFTVNGGSSSRPPADDEEDEDEDEEEEDVTPSVPSTVSGTAGGTATLTVTASATATVTAGGLGDTFLLANASSFTRSGTTYTSRLTLPNQVASYSLTVFVGSTRYPVTVSVSAAPVETGGTLTVRVDPFRGGPGTTATVTVSATGSNNQPANVTVSLSATDGTLSSSSVATGTAGTTTVSLIRGSTAGNENYVTVSGPSGYDSVRGRFIIAGPAGRDTTVGAAADLDAYDGNQQIGSLNSPLAESLVVEVVDANDNPVENARVRFRTTIGSGRFSPRTPRTDEDGFAETTFTPTSAGRIRITATVAGVTGSAAFTVQGGEPADALEKVSGDNQSGTPDNALANPFVVEVQDEDGEPLAGHRVTFEVTAGGGSLSETSAAADEDGRAETILTLGSERGINSVQASVSGVDPVTFSTSIEPKILVAAANRPVMYWIDNGMLYGLAGAKAAKIAENVNGVAIGGGKVYWTEQTGESSGTINSANLDGTVVKELVSIRSVPMGIAVDTAGSKVYWTASSGKIKRANLNGSGSETVLPGLSDPTDIVVSNGFIYWTEGGNSIRRVNISGQVKIAIDVAVNLDTVGGLAVGGGKVYWTEQTGASSGTVNGANLNGTNFGTLASTLSVPMGVAVDTAGSKVYWTSSSGKVKRANLDGSRGEKVVEGLISPSKLAIGGANTEATATVTKKATTPAKKDNAKYDVNGDGAVDNTDASLVAAAMNTSNAKYDVNGDGTVNFLDLLLVFDNREDAAAAPAIVGMKLNAVQIDRIEEQIDLLIATNDRSPAALRTLVYLQQLLATARPEKTQLFANYPNPFNPETWIPYELATDTHVRITIYNTQGVVIRTLQFGHQSAGYYTGRDRAAYWDGRNALGEQVASGLYFYQLETDEMSSMRKMVILK